MIMVKPERALSIEDLLDSAESRLGIKEIAGCFPPHYSRSRFCAAGFTRVVADLPFPSHLRNICIIPSSECSHSEETKILIPNFPSDTDPLNNSCIVLTGEGSIPEFLLNSEMLILSSEFDQFLFESRLIGLIREKIHKSMIIPGGLVNIYGMGVIIAGESGLGKTSCSLELIKKGHQWVADDIVALEKKSDGYLYGRNYDSNVALLEIKGRGIVQAEEVMPSSSLRKESRIDCIVELMNKEDMMQREKEHHFRERKLMNVILPYASLCVAGDPSYMAGEMENAVSKLAGIENLR